MKHLPVVGRGGDSRKDRKRKLLGLIRYDSIARCLRSVDYLLSRTSQTAHAHRLPRPDDASGR